MSEQSCSDDFSLSPTALPKVKHPWRRYFARQLDFAVYSLLWSAVSLLALRWNTGDGVFLRLLEVYITFCLMLFIEPLLLSALGTTPGKWIFGLRVRDEWGGKLTYSGALLRTWRIFHYGYGYAIPFYSLYRNYKSYQICSDDGELPWDEYTAYTITDRKIWRAAAFIGANVLLLLITVLIVFQAEMPRNRGALTAAEFTRNFNDLMDYKKLKLGMHLDEKGKWTQDAQNPGGARLDLFDLPLPDFHIIQTNGEVTRIYFEVTSSEGLIMDSYTNMMILAVKSYVGAQKEINFISQLSVIPRENTAFNNFEYTRAGITVKNSVTYEGYHPAGATALFPDDAEKQYFHLEFSMEKTA